MSRPACSYFLIFFLLVFGTACQESRPVPLDPPGGGVRTCKETGCRRGEVCTSRGTCELMCLIDRECPPNQVCSSGICVVAEPSGAVRCEIVTRSQTIGFGNAIELQALVFDGSGAA